MDQLIPSLAALVEAPRDGFHPQVFSTFRALIAGWIDCLGPRTISEVWRATGLAARRHHDTVMPCSAPHAGSGTIRGSSRPR
jgi:hypothetical protein